MHYINQLFEDGLFVFIGFFVISFILIKIILAYTLKLLRKKYHTNTEIITKIIKIISYVIWIYLIMLQIKPLKNFSLSLLASGGILAVVIGFASQDSVSNLISGLFIIIFKPFVVGDTIKVENGLIIGVVEDITLRHTIIRSFENTKQVISNARLNALTIENISDFSSCKGSPLIILLDLDANIEQAMTLIEQIIAENKQVVKHSKLLVSNISNVGIEIRSMIFTNSPPQTNETLSELRTAIVIQFQKHHIPFAKHRTLQ